MVPLFVLLISFVLLFGVGVMGVRKLSSPKEAARIALAVMFLFTAATHFTGMKHDYLAMIPDLLPKNLWLIYFTGLLEFAGAIGLLFSRWCRAAGICLIFLLIAMFPANVYAALQNIPFRGEPPTPLGIRTLMQAFFIGMLWWSTVKAPSKEKLPTTPH